jgi:endogenous inhibitor of DNA gyrase (YacG/DUF329 family)
MDTTLRRCPACHNTVARESLVCPICGRNCLRVIVGRIVFGVVALLLAAMWIGRRFL